ncbi:unnamed protein product, partial [Prunus brigantina]
MAQITFTLSAAYAVVVLSYWQLAFTGHWGFWFTSPAFSFVFLTVAQWTIVMANPFAVTQISGCFQILQAYPTYAYSE